VDKTSLPYFQQKERKKKEANSDQKLFLFITKIIKFKNDDKNNII
jgi:hypothetical protein